MSYSAKEMPAGSALAAARRAMRPSTVSTSRPQDLETRAQQTRERILRSPVFRHAPRARPNARDAAAIAAMTPTSARLARQDQLRDWQCRRLLRPSPVVFIDWDDTVLPTSWIAEPAQRLRPASSLRTELLPIADALQDLLEELNRLECHVVLVTNANLGWVEETVANFFPSLAPLLCPHQCSPSQLDAAPATIPAPRVVSARHLFRRLHPRRPTAWKAGAFACELHRLDQERHEYLDERRRSMDYRHAMRPRRMVARDPSVASGSSYASMATTEAEPWDAEPASPFGDVASTVNASAARFVNLRLDFCDEDNDVVEQGPVSPATTADIYFPDTDEEGEAKRRGLPRDGSRHRLSTLDAAATMPICDQVVTIGDSHHEHKACRIVAKQFDVHAKTLHLELRASPDVIQRQLRTITDSMAGFLAFTEDMDADVDI